MDDDYIGVIIGFILLAIVISMCVIQLIDYSILQETLSYVTI